MKQICKSTTEVGGPRSVKQGASWFVDATREMIPSQATSTCFTKLGSPPQCSEEPSPRRGVEGLEKCSANSGSVLLRLNGNE